MPGRLVQTATRARNLKRKIARDRADALAALVSEGASVTAAGARMGLTKGETARAWANIKSGLGWQAR
jgi:hypothetical protein